MATALTNARLLLDQGFETGPAVLIDEGRIAAVAPPSEMPTSAERVDLDGAILAPGFIDVQVNGGGGVLFNDAPTVETIRAIGRAHRRFGTTGFLPTLISDELSVVREGDPRRRRRDRRRRARRARHPYRGPFPQRRAQGHPRRLQDPRARRGRFRGDHRPRAGAARW